MTVLRRSTLLREAEKTLPSKEEADKQVDELLKSQGLPPTFDLLPEPLGACFPEENKAVVLLGAFRGIFHESAELLLKAFNIMPQSAQALEIGAGPVCFRVGGGGETVGVNFPAPCCKCSIKKKPVGCLNVCSGSAIWDPATKICGCNL